MTELTLARALEEIRLIQQTGRKEGLCAMRAGRITVDYGGVEMGLDGCPICGGVRTMGFLVVRHEDGRSIQVDMATFHNVQAGHPIPETLVGPLIAIVADG